MIKKHYITKSNLHTVKMPRKCVAVSTIHRHCATHCKPETKKTRDSSNALFVHSLKLLTDDQVTSQRFNSKHIILSCVKILFE